jgi:MraZ protein
MFRGATKITLDDKGRMVMPTRYREQISELAQGKLVVTVDKGPCLLIYPLPEWEQTERELMNVPNLDAKSRWLQRVMVGQAEDLLLDGHGRVLLPPGLREFAKLGRHGMLIGQRTRFELWDEVRWNEGRDAWLAQPATDPASQLASLKL